MTANNMAGSSASSAPLVAFEVRGVPAAQGSKRHVGRGIMVESSKKVAPWRSDVKAAAEAVLPGDWVPLDGAVSVSVAFRFLRPKSVSVKKRRHMTTTPDLDKTIRSTLDALTAAGVWRDDSQVVSIVARKMYADDEPQGATIVIEKLEN